MKIHQRCGTTLRRRAIKLKFEQNENIFLKVMKHNCYQQNMPKIFIVTRLPYKIELLTILLCMELLKATVICYQIKLNFIFHKKDTTIVCFKDHSIITFA